MYNAETAHKPSENVYFGLNTLGSKFFESGRGQRYAYDAAGDGSHSIAQTVPPFTCATVPVFSVQVFKESRGEHAEQAEHVEHVEHPEHAEQAQRGAVPATPKEQPDASLGKVAGGQASCRPGSSGGWLAP